MTRRLYYDDAYRTAFSARVIRRLRHADHPAVILDQTCFYPTGGGQPCDMGWLNGVEVIDVIASEENGAILHVLAADLDLSQDQVAGRIVWSRRFDHMQQHTGQHILSQAFMRTANAETVSFHLGSEVVTIDLNVPRLSPEQVEEAERLANQVVFSDRPVRARFVPPEELAAYPLRRPPQVQGPVRVVEIEGFDATPCGGTHVARTGEIGMIKIIRLDKRGEETRVEFRCGERALADYGRKNQMVQQLAGLLTTGHFELDQAVERLQAEIKQLHRQLRQAQERLVAYEAAELAAQAERVGELTVIRRVFSDRDPGQLRQLALRLAVRPKTVALLGLAGAKAHVIGACSQDVQADMVTAVRVALHALGSSGGGGRPQFAQGGGATAHEGQVAAALEQALATVMGGASQPPPSQGGKAGVGEEPG